MLDGDDATSPANLWADFEGVAPGGVNLADDGSGVGSAGAEGGGVGAAAAVADDEEEDEEEEDAEWADETEEVDWDEPTEEEFDVEKLAPVLLKL